MAGTEAGLQRDEMNAEGLFGGVVLRSGDSSRFGSLISQEAQEWKRRPEPQQGIERREPRHVS